MLGLLKYVLVVLLCLLIGVTLVNGVIVLFTGVSLKLDSLDFALLMSMVQS